MSATHQFSPVAKLEQKTVVDLILKGKRLDERGPLDYRPLTIMLGTIEKANGSAYVYLGKTKVLAGIKVEIGTPFPDTPDEGILSSCHSPLPHLRQGLQTRTPSNWPEWWIEESENQRQ